MIWNRYDTEKLEFIYREIDRYADDYTMMPDEYSRACVDIGCSAFIGSMSNGDRKLEDALWEYYVKQQGD